MKSHIESVHDRVNDTIEDVCSTQNMIEDARARKKGQKIQQCDQCEYKTGSNAMLRVHKRTKHKDIEGLEQNENSVEDRMTNENSVENRKLHKQINKYISKRRKCELCEKKFNKEATYNKHMNTIHEGRSMVVNTNITSIELNLSK